MKNGLFFVNKQLFWWSASITLDNNNAVLTDLWPFFLLNTLPHTSAGLTRCIFIVLSVLNIFSHFKPCIHLANLPMAGCCNWSVPKEPPEPIHQSQGLCWAHEARVAVVMDKYPIMTYNVAISEN